MRRIPRASASRLFGRVCAIPLTLGMLLGTGLSGGAGLAPADPGSDIAALVAAVAEANQKLQDLGAAVQSQQESVNKAIVDVQTARDAAAAAQREVDTSRVGVKDANAAIAAAQQRFDTFAAATYVSGPSGSYLTAADPADIVDTAAAGQTLAASAQQVIADLQRARTEQVNKESAARLAKQNADKAAADAQASQDAAVSALTSAQQTFGSQQAELDRLTAERSGRTGQARRRPHLVRAGRRPATRCRPGCCPGCRRRPLGSGCARVRRAAARHQTVGHPVGSHAAGDTQRLRQRRPDRDHQHRAGHLGDLGPGHR